ncbi:hypothetical protein LTR62_006327 [Meristemomyces frigidus]|uniref:Uncharacterized protein n=1 Tax=Meristemomyces frigidus TaxID=1508187 RepID=A0AAN7TK17_9PEZI|nr:hypothetical protein LTR62_006327 [Meristemomyces frigidus]
MAAEPLLASSLWQPNETATNISANEPTQLATGLHTLDQALNGGLQYGSLTCISSEPDSDTDVLIHQILISHLLSNATATATIIDSTLSLNLRKLHRCLVKALQQRDEADKPAMNVLSRLKIMKVFDLVGLTESITEVREALENSMDSPQSFSRPSSAPQGTINHSQNEQDSILDQPPAAAPPKQLHPSENTAGLLVINNLSDLTKPLQKSNHIQSQALLTSLLRSLRYTTKRHNLCTLLLNSTITTIGYTPQTKPPEETPSIFSSSGLRLALGRTLGYGLDMHLLIHLVPGSVEGARGVYRGGSSSTSGKERVGTGEMGNIVEILQDRWGVRQGRWVGFVVGGDEGLVGL